MATFSSDADPASESASARNRQLLSSGMTRRTSRAASAGTGTAGGSRDASSSAAAAAAGWRRWSRGGAAAGDAGRAGRRVAAPLDRDRHARAVERPAAVGEPRARRQRPPVQRRGGKPVRRTSRRAASSSSGDRPAARAAAARRSYTVAVLAGSVSIWEAPVAVWRRMRIVAILLLFSSFAIFCPLSCLKLGCCSVVGGVPAELRGWERSLL